MLDAPATEMLSIRMFGAMALTIGGRPVAATRARCGDQIIAFLIVQGRPVARQALANAFWPETGSQESVRQSVASVRRALGEHGRRLQGENGFLGFDVEGASVDLVSFYRLSVSDVLEDLLEAISLCGAPLLEGRDEAWVLKARADVRRRLYETVHRAAHMAAQAGRSDVAESLHRKAINLKPALEHGWRDLMEMLVATGERAAAIDLFARYQARRQSHDGLDPSSEMVALHARARASEALGASRAPNTPTLGGAVPLTSTLYVERAIDGTFADALTRRESIVRLQGPRQTGKSSILARGLQRARGAGADTYIVEFGRLTVGDLTSFEGLCLRIAGILAAQQDEEFSLADAWSDALGPGVNLEKFVLRRLLAATNGPVVIAMDDVDRLFEFPFADEFFALLRAWHQRRAMDPSRPWGRLSLALVFATDAHLYLKNLHHSPFNVGFRASVEDLTPAQLDDLAGRHGASFRGPSERTRFRRLVGGHAYFACRALHAMAEMGWSVDDLAEHAHREDGPLADSLQDLWGRLAADEALLEAVRGVLAGAPCAERAFARLRSGGILAGEPGEPVFRNDVVQRYLQARL